MTDRSVLNPRPGENSVRTTFSSRWHWSKAHDRLVIRALLALGFVLRLRQYLFNRSLWLDESLLALNLIGRSASELLKPLSYHQGAPLGFLMLEKAVIRFLGSSEMALRLIPFLAGIASLFIFAELARKFLAPDAVPVAVGLFAVSARVIYYSSEVKQYSTDVAVALILFLVASSVMVGTSTIFRKASLSLVASVLIWFSQPAAFVVAAIGIAWLWVGARRHDRSALICAGIFTAFGAGSFVLSYLVSLRNLAHDQSLMGYWSGGFMPMPPFSSEGAWWFVNSWLKMCEDPVGLTFVGIATAAAVIGTREMFREGCEKLLLLALPIFFTLVASGMHRYPFRGRLLLFAVPSVLVVVAAGLAAIRTKTRNVMPGLGVLLIGLLVFHPLENAVHFLHKPLGVEEIRPALEFVEKHRTGGDILYCYYSAEPALTYYSSRQKIQAIPVVIGVESRQNWVRYRQDLDHLRGDSRVWVLFSHVYRDGGADEERLFLDYLDGMGKREDGMQAVGASVYLYDLRAQ